MACICLLSDFIDAIQNEGKFPISLTEGRKVIHLCLDAIKSYQNNKTVRLTQLDAKSA